MAAFPSEHASVRGETASHPFYYQMGIPLIPCNLKREPLSSLVISKGNPSHPLQSRKGTPLIPCNLKRESSHPGAARCHRHCGADRFCPVLRPDGGLSLKNKLPRHILPGACATTELMPRFAGMPVWVRARSFTGLRGLRGLRCTRLRSTFAPAATRSKGLPGYERFE